MIHFHVEDTNYDSLNSRKCRNRDNTERHDYNCAGFALETYNWYAPYTKKMSNIKLIEQLISNGIDDEDLVTAIMLNYNVSIILKDFKDRVRVFSHHTSPLKENERLIAFRVYFEWRDDCKTIFDCDFHFMKKEDDIWYEKMGGCPIEEVCKAEYPSLDDWGVYNSDTIYLAVKI